MTRDWTCPTCCYINKHWRRVCEGCRTRVGPPVDEHHPNQERKGSQPAGGPFPQLAPYALGIAVLVGVFAWTWLGAPPDACEALRLHCDLAQIQGPARRLQLCEVIEYREPRMERTCVSLLRAIRKAEAEE